MTTLYFQFASSRDSAVGELTIDTFATEALETAQAELGLAQSRDRTASHTLVVVPRDVVIVCGSEDLRHDVGTTLTSATGGLCDSHE